MAETVTNLFVLKFGQTTWLERVDFRLTVNVKILQTVVNGNRQEVRFGAKG